MGFCKSAARDYLIKDATLGNLWEAGIAAISVYCELFLVVD
jgi:hypothetical protein